MKQKQKPLDFVTSTKAWMSGKAKLILIWFTFCLVVLYYFSPSFTTREIGFQEHISTKDSEASRTSIRAQEPPLQISPTNWTRKSDTKEPDKQNFQIKEGLHCDFSHWCTNVCEMRGEEVKFDCQSMTAVVHSRRKAQNYQKVKLRPYPFKHDKEIMSNVEEVTLLEPLGPGNRSLPASTGNDYMGTGKVRAADQYKFLVSKKMASQENHFQLLTRLRRVLKKAKKEGKEGKGERIRVREEGEEASRKKNGSISLPSCQVWHSVPGVVFSVGGFTGNPYHEWQNGIVPLWITSQHLKGNVSFVVLQASDWWVSKYMRVLQVLSRFPLIVPAEDPFVHCFPSLTVGLKFHEEMAVNPRLMPAGETIHDFQLTIKQALGPRKGTLNPFPEGKLTGCRPVLLFMERRGTRVLLNAARVLAGARRLGFAVRRLEPGHSTLLEDVWALLRGTDLLFGVHGAALTHFLFLRPGAAYVQVVPFGVERVAHEFLGTPAVKLGLHYSEYRVTRNESSLSQKYSESDPVFTEPDRLFREGKSHIFLKQQNLTLDEDRVQKVFEDALSRLRTSRYFQRQRKQAAANANCAGLEVGAQPIIGPGGVALRRSKKGRE